MHISHLENMRKPWKIDMKFLYEPRALLRVGLLLIDKGSDVCCVETISL